MDRCTTDSVVDVQHGNLPKRKFLPLIHTQMASIFLNLSGIKRAILNVVVIHFDIKEAVATMPFIVISDTSDVEIVPTALRNRLSATITYFEKCMVFDILEKNSFAEFAHDAIRLGLKQVILHYLLIVNGNMRETECFRSRKVLAVSA